MKRLLLYSLLFTFLGSCSSGIEPIDYGHEDCYYCGMSIIDQQYGAELVTTKGKVRKFDAIECMIRFIRNNQDLQYSDIVVNVFDRPGELLSASGCTYLVSRNLPSPMGANLTAFSSGEKAAAVQKQKSGDLFNWHELLDSENF